jgi:hypothetical protein
MDINSVISDLQSNLTALQTDAASVKITLDSACFGSVMGPAVKAAGAPASEVASMITDDLGLTKSIEELTTSQQSAIRMATRKLMDKYATQVAQSAVQTVASHYETVLVKPSMATAMHIGNRTRGLITSAGEIASLAARLNPKTNNRSAARAIEITFNSQVGVVTEFASTMSTFDDIITRASVQIAQTMSSCSEDSDYAERLKAKQDTRTAVQTEKKYAEQQLMETFDGGAARNCAGIKITLKDLVVPTNLSKSKGVEFIKELTYYFKGRAPWYYTILPYTIRIMAESKIGNHFLPPNKADRFTGCPREFRDKYVMHAAELYDYLEIHVSKEIMANIRKPFKYGLEDQVGQCEVGDGPMAIFCILALYRPSGENYREEIKEKICGLATKFNDGTNPTAKINECMNTLQEAIDLDIKIPWNRTGKTIITLLSERSNTFARALTVFTEVGAIVDKDDAAIELKNMFAAVVEACKALQDSGQEVKRIMAVDTQGKPNKGGKGKTNESGDQSNPCHFGEKCTRQNCTFGHTKEENAKKASSQSKGKGSKGGKGGQGAGSKGKGGKTKFSGPCQAAKCTAPGKGFRLCTKCHRSGIESGKAIKLKDGADFKVEVSAKTSQEKRIAQLEKRLAQREEDGEDSDQEFEEPASAGKRKRVTFASGSKNDQGSGSILDRLGLPSHRMGPNGTALNSPATDSE